MLEKVIEKNVVNYAKSKGWLAYKFTSTSCRGVPDRLCIGPEGQFFFIEFKRKGHLPTALQEVNIKDIRSHHIKVFIIDEVEKGRLLIDEYHETTSSIST